MYVEQNSRTTRKLVPYNLRKCHADRSRCNGPRATFTPTEIITPLRLAIAERRARRLGAAERHEGAGESTQGFLTKIKLYHALNNRRARQAVKVVTRACKALQCRRPLPSLETRNHKGLTSALPVSRVGIGHTMERIDGGEVGHLKSHSLDET